MAGVFDIELSDRQHDGKKPVRDNTYDDELSDMEDEDLEYLDVPNVSAADKHVLLSY